MAEKSVIGWYRNWLEHIADKAPKSDTASYTVMWSKNIYMIECQNCGYAQVIPNREKYNKLKSKECACKACRAIFNERIAL